MGIPTLWVCCVYEVNSMIMGSQDVCEALFGIEKFLAANTVSMGGHGSLVGKGIERLWLNTFGQMVPHRGQAER